MTGDQNTGSWIVVTLEGFYKISHERLSFLHGSPSRGCGQLEKLISLLPNETEIVRAPNPVGEDIVG